MGRIRVLSEALANQIAAGEVVERPASVVKELLENALDAGAARVTVAIRGGGCESIVVRDDGEGMAREDAALAFARHATSKIRDAGDLVSIASFGFRGEALSSIAAAADVELLTRRPDEESGTRVRVRGGVIDTSEAGAPPGTRVEVQNLFASLPARRKFLKRPATEFGHIGEMVTRLAIAAPEVGFVVTHDDREVLNYPPVGHPAERLLQALGKDAGGDLVEFETQDASLSVNGYLGRPERSLSTARLVLTYVDGRFVRDRVLTRAILDGYDTVLMKGRYPLAVVFLRAAPGDVDVNVHPTKAEVRFHDPGRVHRLLAGGIRRRLREALGAAAGASRVEGVRMVAARAVGTAPAAADDTSVAGRRSAGEQRLTWRRVAEATMRDEASRQDPGAGQAGEARVPYGGRPGLAEPLQAVSGELGTAASGFRSLAVLGQVLDGYLACASRRGLVLIDQHAAHERVRFEQLRGQLASGSVAVQRLLVPEPLTLGVRDVQALEEAGEALVRLGLEGEPFGDGTYLLRAVPALRADSGWGAVVRDLAAELAEVGAGRGLEATVDALLARMACHSAVRVGRRMEPAEIQALLHAMDGIDLAGYCPHGRPAYVELDAGALERMFKR
jgi:DNA mismatch repair protein MutL